MPLRKLVGVNLCLSAARGGQICNADRGPSKTSRTASGLGRGKERLRYSGNDQGELCGPTRGDNKKVPTLLNTITAHCMSPSQRGALTLQDVRGGGGKKLIIHGGKGEADPLQTASSGKKCGM